ncbi:MAG: hypothetical protein AB1765_09490 [Candidatus Hydrogenedentota bacterium]
MDHNKIVFLFYDEFHIEPIAKKLDKLAVNGIIHSIKKNISRNISTVEINVSIDNSGRIIVAFPYDRVLVIINLLS